MYEQLLFTNRLFVYILTEHVSAAPGIGSSIVYLCLTADCLFCCFWRELTPDLLSSSVRLIEGVRAEKGIATCRKNLSNIVIKTIFQH